MKFFCKLKLQDYLIPTFSSRAFAKQTKYNHPQCFEQTPIFHRKWRTPFHFSHRNWYCLFLHPYVLCLEMSKVSQAQQIILTASSNTHEVHSHLPLLSTVSTGSPPSLSFIPSSSLHSVYPHLPVPPSSSSFTEF